MGISYVGIHISSLTYIVLLLFGLIIFIIILIATEKQRQRRHNKELHRMHHTMHNVPLQKNN